MLIIKIAHYAPSQPHSANIYNYWFVISILESPADDQSYPALFEKLSLTRGNNLPPTSNVESTSADIFPKSTKSVNIGVFPSSTTTSNSHSRFPHTKRPQPISPIASQIPNHPMQQQMARLPLKQPLLPPPSFYSNQGNNRIPMPGRVDSPVHQNGHHPSVFASSAPPLNQHPLSFVGPLHHVPIPLQQGVPHPGNFPGGYVQSAVPNGAVFGAVGQATRSPFHNNHNHHNIGMNATPPGSPNMARNMNQGNQVSRIFILFLRLVLRCSVIFERTSEFELSHILRIFSIFFVNFFARVRKRLLTSIRMDALMLFLTRIYLFRFLFFCLTITQCFILLWTKMYYVL